MPTHRLLGQLAQRLQTQTQTLNHALQGDWDPQLLLEISFEISLLSSQFRDHVLAEMVKDPLPGATRLVSNWHEPSD